MDQIQPHPGHVLIVPNTHIANIFSIDEEVAAQMFKITTRIAKAVKKVFKPHGVDIYQCNGKCAGQSVFHMHIHVFPRERNDGYFRIYPEGCPKLADNKTLSKYKRELKKHI
jgi:histidine triad (HIT) family protein